MGRFVAALLGGGTNEHGSILRPATLATIFEPHFQPDSRLPGMGLGFFRSDAGRHRVVGHDGRLPGFHSQLFVAPDDGLGVVAFTNGSSRAMLWLPTELEGLLHSLLGVPQDAVRPDIPQHPEIWNDLCGLYRAKVIDLRGRLMMGGGVEVIVHGGQLKARLLTPIPAAYRGIQLHADDETDPYVFRIDLSQFGMGTSRVVFSRADGTGTTTAVHTDMGLLSFQKRPHERNPGRWSSWPRSMSSYPYVGEPGAPAGIQIGSKTCSSPSVAPAFSARSAAHARATRASGDPSKATPIRVPAEPPRAVSARCDRERARGAVNEALARAAEQRLPDGPAVTGADDEHVGVLVLGERVEPARDGQVRDHPGRVRNVAEAGDRAVDDGLGVLAHRGGVTGVEAVGHAATTRTRARRRARRLRRSRVARQGRERRPAGRCRRCPR